MERRDRVEPIAQRCYTGTVEPPDHLRSEVDDAGAEFEASPVVRSIERCQRLTERFDPSVTVRLASEPIDLRGFVRVEDDEGFGRWVRDREPPVA